MLNSATTSTSTRILSAHWIAHGETVMSVSIPLLIWLFPCVEALLFGCDNQCGVPSLPFRTARIVGGHESTLGAMPWMVAIANEDFFLCGGSIIGNSLILTAAHCFDNSRNASRLRVYAAKHSLLKANAEEQQLSVAKLLLHAGYDDTSGVNDIALLVLSKPLTFGTLIAPICLPQSNLKVAGGLACTVAGWGVTEGTGKDYVLNELIVPIIDDSTCGRPDWRGDIFVPQVSFCAGYKEGGKDACLGDSGSPLIHNFNNKWTAVGIVSTGEDCALPQKPGIYTNVSHYVSWIEQTCLLNSLPFPCSVQSRRK